MENNRFESLPKEIQSKIISYTYMPQPTWLQRDIQSCQLIRKANLYYYHFWIVEVGERMYEDRNWLINDLSFFLNDHIPSLDGYTQKYYDTFRRLFLLQKKSDEELDIFFDKLWFQPVNFQINLVWGILVESERIEFLKRYIRFTE